MIEKMEGKKNGRCDNCSAEAELHRYGSRTRCHPVEWLCEYCENMSYMDSSDAKNIARAMHVLEKRIIAHINNGDKNE